MGAAVMGLDFGGGGGRCLLLDVERGTKVVTTRRWKFDNVAGSGGLGFDIDLERAFAQLADAAREALALGGVAAEDVKGIAATALRLGTVLLDSSGEALLAVPNRDSRAVGAGLMMGAQHGKALYACTGRWPYPIHTAARLQWMQSDRPRDFEHVSDVLAISDWLAFRLCGERVTDPTQAGETLLFDIAARRWSDSWVATLGLPRDILPCVAEPGSMLGRLTAEAAEALGLTTDTRVAVGAADTQSALLGSGALSPGDTVVVGGTTAPVQQVVDQPLIDPAQRLWTSLHVRPGSWVLESNAGPLGECLDWFARVLYPGDRLALERFFAEAATSEPGAAGLLSSLGAEVMNAREMGLPVGQLTLSHLSSIDDESPRRHLVRSVAEGAACALRANVEQIESVSGLERREIGLTGGLSRSGTFAQILSDVICAPVVATSTPGASALGAAICASVGAGLFPSLEQAVEALVSVEETREPNADEAEAHAALYTRWSELRAARAEGDARARLLTMPFALGAGQLAAESRRSAKDQPSMLVTADFDEAAVRGLRALGQVEYASFRDAGRMLVKDSLVEALAGRQVFITEIDLVDAGSLERLPELRLVGTCRSGAVNVDIEACTAFGIPVLNTPGRNADSVADLTLGFMLMLARRFPEAGRFLAQPGIEPGDIDSMGRAFVSLQGQELWRKTIGLVGLGAVGRKVAERLAGFGARVIAADPMIDRGAAAMVGAELVPLEQLLEQSDFVSLHAAVTDETTGMIGADELARMKATAFVINTARAALADEEALLAVLQKGAIAGAALDTFSVEPPGSEHPFMALDNVISTPHVAGNTTDVAAHQGDIILGELRLLLAGERPRHVLNPETLANFSWQGARPKPDAALLERLKQGSGPVVTDLQKKSEKKKAKKA